MKSLIIGIARTGKPHNYVLNEDTKYISMCGNKPEVSFSIGCEQDQFIKAVAGLRYDDADPDASAGPISFFQNLTTQIFQDLKYLKIEENDFSPLHIRLVTTPFELAQIPFEFTLTPPNIAGETQIPLLAHPERKITLTREIRQESEARYVWPYQPRILFAWAQPDPEMTVPYEDHLNVLKAIVSPLAKPQKDVPDPTPDIAGLITELPNASVDSIKMKIQEGVAKEKPYTHLHILAHGGQKLVYGVTEFRLVLCKDGNKDEAQKVSGESLANAIVPVDKKSIPTVVSLCVCDSGNVGNTIFPTGSLIYQLHNAGVPCVFASQFPLTQPGSVQLVKTLYHQLINACDPRMALYETRIELKKASNHDWASLVAYARFPEDINEQLQAANLKMLFNSMKITNAWVDHAFKFLEKIEPGNREPILLDLENRLTQSIEELSKFLNPENKRESNLANALLQAEHFGLLGSGYKRKAEYLFRLVEFNPARKTDLVNRSIEAVNKAKEFYNCGLEANPTSHWTAMQYLSLKAISEGILEDESEIWYVTKRMAERDEKKSSNEEDRIWAWGTLAELFLLKPLTIGGKSKAEEISSAIAISKNYIKRMAGADKKYNSAKESTIRQFERYINWWPKLFQDTYPKWMIESATEIRNLLPTLDSLN